MQEAVQASGEQTRVASIASNDDKDDRAQDHAAQSSPKMSIVKRLKAHADESITHGEATIPLAWQALLTGMVDALIYSRSTIWTGFQTGNMVQFSQNIAQYMLPNAQKYPLETLERAVSVLSFILGSLIGGRISAKLGASTRKWLFLSAVLQSLFLWGAAGILLSLPEDDPPNFRYWPPIIMFTAMSMGLQSVTAQKIASPTFATTVAFTATLTQIAADPFLFHLAIAPIEQIRMRYRNRQNSIEGQSGAAERIRAAIKEPKTLGRERRLFAIFSLCVGAGVAECLLNSRTGLRGAMAIAAAFRFVQAILWLFATPKERSTVKNEDVQIVSKPSVASSNQRVEIEPQDRNVARM